MNRGLRDTLTFVAGITFGIFAYSVLGAGNRLEASSGIEVTDEKADAAMARRDLAVPTTVPDTPTSGFQPVSHRTPVEADIDFSSLAPKGMVEMLQAPMPTDAELEVRYGEMSLPELIGARKGLAYVVHSEATAFLEQKMERGLYTTQIIPLGTMISHDGRFPDGAPRMFMTKTHTMQDGMSEVWTADIHPKEQPLLERRHAELAWLGARVHRLQKAHH